MTIFIAVTYLCALFISKLNGIVSRELNLRPLELLVHCLIVVKVLLRIAHYLKVNSSSLSISGVL